jgi:hypothetical protein
LDPLQYLSRFVLLVALGNRVPGKTQRRCRNNDYSENCHLND